jgi:hypothetical protein
MLRCKTSKNSSEGDGGKRGGLQKSATQSGCGAQASERDLTTEREKKMPVE